MKVELLHPDAKLPTRGSEGAAGFDLYAIDDIEVPPCELRKIPLGIRTEIPRGWVGLIRDRSSLGSKGFVTAAGVIDSDYRGEWKVVIRNTRLDNSLRIVRGDRIAQVVLTPCYGNPPQRVESLDLTGRGDGGFGSTGK